MSEHHMSGLPGDDAELLRRAGTGLVIRMGPPRRDATGALQRAGRLARKRRLARYAGTALVVAVLTAAVLVPLAAAGNARSRIPPGHQGTPVPSPTTTPRTTAQGNQQSLAAERYKTLFDDTIGKLSGVTRFVIKVTTTWTEISEVLTGAPTDQSTRRGQTGPAYLVLAQGTTLTGIAMFEPLPGGQAEHLIGLVFTTVHTALTLRSAREHPTMTWPPLVTTLATVTPHNPVLPTTTTTTTTTTQPPPPSATITCPTSAGDCSRTPGPGNGNGPTGTCTGEETAPPCGPGAVPDQSYPFSLVGQCTGLVWFDGREWLLELIPSSTQPPVPVWIHVTASGKGAGWEGPHAGAVGMDPYVGQQLGDCGSTGPVQHGNAKAEGTWPAATFTETSSYVTTVASQRVIVYAGAVPGPGLPAADVSQRGGEMRVAVSTPKGPFSLEKYPAPTSGAVTITAVTGDIVLLTATTGKTLHFDFTTGAYTTAG